MILYKYCPWDDYAKENLMKSQLYPQVASKENDPFDHLPAFNRQDWVTKIAKVHRLPVLRVNKDYNKFIDYWINDIKSHTFIICLSKEYNDILMWSHYADSHRGICIGYDASKCTNRIIPVAYSNKRVVIPSAIYKKPLMKY